MSSGQGRVKVGFNNTQIKDGWIVRMRKDGQIKAKIAPYEPKHPKKVN
jgi:hypothetical protein